jgi:DNA-binding transcriptional ArsR family regulator
MFTKEYPNQTFEDLEDKLHHAVELLKSLSNERRLLIVCALCRQERSVGELEKIVELSQSALSQHLARLRRDGLVDTRREAQTIYYSMKDEKARVVLLSLMHIFCPEKFRDSAAAPGA